MRARRALGWTAAILLSLTTLGCVPEAAPGTGQATTFVSVVDGDTVETSEGTVRIVGIDTPERGECGADRAAAALEGVLTRGEAIVLESSSDKNDRDRYGRLIRFVTTSSGVDVALYQLEVGNAVARYDSSDGYPRHPREAAYRSAQRASLGADGSVVTVECQGTGDSASHADGWWEQYSSCAKLRTNDVGHPAGPFSRDDPAQADVYDWFANRTGNNGDGDGDGLACE